MVVITSEGSYLCGRHHCNTEHVPSRAATSYARKTGVGSGYRFFPEGFVFGHRSWREFDGKLLGSRRVVFARCGHKRHSQAFPKLEKARIGEWTDPQVFRAVDEDQAHTSLRESRSNGG
jgi:hypothetical protein